MLLNTAKFLGYNFYRFWIINPIQDRCGEGGEWGKKAPPTSFSPVTSTNVEINHQNFLNFSFNLFATLV